MVAAVQNRDTVKYLVGLQWTRGQEVFFEKKVIEIFCEEAMGAGIRMGIRAIVHVRIVLSLCEILRNIEEYHVILFRSFGKKCLQYLADRGVVEIDENNRNRFFLRGITECLQCVLHEVCVLLDLFVGWLPSLLDAP